MNPKKLIKKNLMLIVLMITLMSCAQEKIIPPSEYPSEIKSFASTHFPNNKILQVVQDKEVFTTTYDAILSENINLEFNKTKEVIDIDGVTKLPNSVIPKNILQYVTANYPNNFITDWELDKNGQQVGLDNGLDLEFNKKGEFLRLDD